MLFLICSLNLSAQQLTVTGKVSDATTGESMPGVTIQIAGTTSGTLTQADGTYSLTVPSANQTLIFSFVGYATQQIDVAGRTVIDLALQEEVTALEEIVVTGYSTERKKDIIGAVSVVNTDELLSTPSGSISAQLQGRAAGVTVTSTGEAGGSARVRVRGFGTFTESEPLYIIDGVPGDINRINPNDVASIQILKDAASAAVYGARAANGVVIVTTKTGTSGTTKVNLDVYYGWQYLGKKWYPDVLNAQEYGELYWESMRGAGLSPGDAGWYHAQYGTGPEPVIPEYILVTDKGARYGGTELEYLRTTDPATFNELVDPANYDLATHQIVKSADTDWAEEMFHLAPIQNYQVTVSGGVGKNNYLVSVNYFDQSSIVSDMTYFKRYTARANSTLSPFDRLRIGENVQVRYSKQRNLDYVDNAWWFHPLIPLYDIAGNMASSAAPATVQTGGTTGMNPVVGPEKEYMDYTENIGVFGNVFADVDILKDLTVRSSYGFDLNYRTVKNFFPIYYENSENQQPYPDRLLYTNAMATSWVWTNTATYSKTLGNHVIRVLVGTEATNNLAKRFNMERYGYTADLQQFEEFIVLQAGTGAQSNDGVYIKSTLFSLFGRLDYTFADKYIFNATVRRDGSSKFGKNNRYGVFPSTAIGWRISEEPFMQNLTWLTDLKLRASRGVIGNEAGLTETNQYSMFQGSDFYNYGISGGQNTVSPNYILSAVGNPNAKWEKTVTTNIGLDATFLQGRLSFSAEYYLRETIDLLVQNQAPTTGTIATQPSINAGEMLNKGLDISASYRGVAFGELGYEVSANFTKYKNEVIKVLDNPLSSIIVAGSGQAINYSRTIKGYPIAHFYGFKIDGFFESQAEVDAYEAAYTTWVTPRVGGWRMKDISGPNGVPDNVVNDYDRTIIGSPHPDWQANFSLSLNYKNFDLFATAFWSQGGDLWNGLRLNADFWTGIRNKSTRMLTESWTPDNPDAKLPALDISDNTSVIYSSDYFIEDATYFRIRTIQLGYTVPASLSNRLRIDRLRIYGQVQNPFTWCKEFSGMDPDAGFAADASGEGIAADLSIGTVGGTVPTPQQFLFGVNFTF
ncbi:MAG: TonB-dependent receptor [Bacteroidales bacterium]|nr:TonB-dependent receptor [Bacteroidales bacterium]